jgi:hypothetical protein
VDRRQAPTFSGVLMALVVFFVVVPLGSCVACMVCAQIRRETRAGSSSPTASAPTEPAPPATATPVAATTAPIPNEVRCSFAIFMSGGEHLGVCVDYVVSSTVPLTDVLPDSYTSGADRKTRTMLAEAGVRTKGDYMDFGLRDDVSGLQRGGDSMSGRWLGDFGVKFKAKDVQLLGRRCGDMFSDRVELASCDFDSGATGDAGTTWDIAMHLYSQDALNGDTALHGCLKEHGKWNALPRDSHEYKREQIRQNLERVNGDLEKLRGVTQ